MWPLPFLHVGILSGLTYIGLVRAVTDSVSSLRMSALCLGDTLSWEPAISSGSSSLPTFSSAWILEPGGEGSDRDVPLVAGCSRVSHFLRAALLWVSVLTVSS